MKIQCKDGIFDTGMAEFSQYNADRMRLQFVALSRADLRAGKPVYQTPITVENARAVLEAQLRKEQRLAAEAAEKRASYLSGLSDDDLLELERRTLGANLLLPQDVQTEMGRRGLNAPTHVDTGDFAQYVEAKNRAAREGRLDAFRDGIG